MLLPIGAGIALQDPLIALDRIATLAAGHQLFDLWVEHGSGVQPFDPASCGGSAAPDTRLDPDSVAVCVGLAALLLVLAGIDPLTAYLATSPGGADSVAIIAVASDVDVAFVMPVQTTRLFLVLLIGPSFGELHR